MDVSKLKVAEIKKELKDRGLNTVGNKQELAARLQEAIDAEVIDDDGVDDLNGVEHAVEVGAKEEEEVLEPKVEEKSARKIVLNRKIEFASDSEAPKEQAKDDSSATEADAKPTATSAERLALRAKRFGQEVVAPATTEAVKTEEDAPEAKKAKVEEDPAVQIEVLKKRAERFGVTVSPTIEKVEIAGKKRQRQERFSTSTENSTTEAKVEEPLAPLAGPAVAPTGDIKTMSLEERKKMRAERFK